jgi:mono/diheme cytochrome c family protein
MIGEAPQKSYPTLVAGSRSRYLAAGAWMQRHAPGLRPQRWLLVPLAAIMAISKAYCCRVRLFPQEGAVLSGCWKHRMLCTIQMQEARVLKPFLMLPVLLAGALAAQQPAAAPAAVPADAAQMVNPVKPNGESQAKAKKMYGYDCAMCHGEKGDGKGDLVADMKLTLKDYTDPATLKGLSDGEMFYIIKNGKGQMSGEGDRAKPEDIWNLVIYVRSLAAKQRAAAGEPGSSSRPVEGVAERAQEAPAVARETVRTGDDQDVAAIDALPRLPGRGEEATAKDSKDLEVMLHQPVRNPRAFGEGVPDPFRREWHFTFNNWGQSPGGAR